MTNNFIVALVDLINNINYDAMRNKFEIIIDETTLSTDYI